MAKSKTDSFVLERRLYTNKDDEEYIDQKLNICNRLYNKSAKHCIEQLEKMRQEPDFQEALSQYLKLEKGNPEKTKWLNKVKIFIESYELTEYQIQKYMNYQRVKSFNEAIGANIQQKVATALTGAVNKAIFQGTKIHYRKFGQTTSFEDKKANSGIIYNDQNGTVKVMGRIIKIKLVREKDSYMMEALQHKVKYCRIVRKPFKNKYKYFLQLVMEGTAPKKLKPGKGKCGLDEGTSTVAYYSDSEAGFHVLAEDVEKYDKEIIKCQREYERILKLTNPDNYNEDGTIKKGSKFKRTKNCQKRLMKLKNAYRLKSVYVKQNHNYFINRLIEKYNFFIKEPMDFRALAKRAKQTSRQDKDSFIKKKDGTVIQVKKYKRKKRFGPSINKRSPGYFNSRLEFQVKKYGGDFLDVDKFEYKASQYNHKTQKATKCKLSDRNKKIGKFLVQRDLYSSFLLYHNKDDKTIDFASCNKDFRKYLNKQKRLLKEMKENATSHQDVAYKNFGLASF